MTEDEYRAKLSELKKSHENDLKMLTREFAHSNSLVNIGDVVEDRHGKILVEKISVGVRANLPTCLYFGAELRKDGQPKKNGNKRTVWQNNLKKEK